MYIMSLLLENDAPRDYGCLMAFPPVHVMPHFIKFAKTAVLPHTIYTEEGDSSYGYADEPHVTVKYGFTPDLTKRDLAKVLKGIVPFMLSFSKLSLFENDKFDVVKFDVEPHKILTEIRKRCDDHPNEDKYPDFHPHSTVAYVKKGMFPHIKDGVNIKLPITRFKYSSSTAGGDKKLFINI